MQITWHRMITTQFERNCLFSGSSPAVPPISSWPYGSAAKSPMTTLLPSTSSSRRAVAPPPPLCIPSCETVWRFPISPSGWPNEWPIAGVGCRCQPTTQWATPRLKESAAPSASKCRCWELLMGSVMVTQSAWKWDLFSYYLLHFLTFDKFSCLIVLCYLLFFLSKLIWYREIWNWDEIFYDNSCFNFSSFWTTRPLLWRRKILMRRRTSPGEIFRNRRRWSGGKSAFLMRGFALFYLNNCDSEKHLSGYVLSNFTAGPFVMSK